MQNERKLARRPKQMACRARAWTGRSHGWQRLSGSIHPIDFDPIAILLINILFRRHQLSFYLNNSRYTFDVPILLQVEVTPYKEVDYFQRNIEYECGG